MKRLSVLFLTLCILLTGCAGSYCETRAAFAMDTDILVTAYGSRFTVGGAIDRALAVLNEADTRLSAVDTGSELYRPNSPTRPPHCSHVRSHSRMRPAARLTRPSIRACRRGDSHQPTSAYPTRMNF